MPAKRKAPVVDGRATKRIASGAATPISMDDGDEEYDGTSDEFDEEERQAPRKYDSEWSTPRTVYLQQAADSVICRSSSEVPACHIPETCRRRLIARRRCQSSLQIYAQFLQRDPKT